jgi:hypothetical protein
MALKPHSLTVEEDDFYADRSCVKTDIVHRFLLAIRETPGLLFPLSQKRRLPSAKRRARIDFYIL